jgi:1,2-beta-oligoglucan phosphorylase
MLVARSTQPGKVAGLAASLEEPIWDIAINADHHRPSIKSAAGLTVRFLDNGLIECIEAGPIRLSLNAASQFGNQGANLYLRKRSTPCEYRVLLGPASNSRFTVADNAYIATGCWDTLDYVCRMQLSDSGYGWQWSVELANNSDTVVELDLVYVQDVGLVPGDGAQTNKYYVSQYLERRVLNDRKFGAVICCRQNIEGPTGHPWLMMASCNSAASASVDGMQFYGSQFRVSEIPAGALAAELGGEYSGELSILALQETPFALGANGTHRSSFMVTYLADHPQATSDDDLQQLPELIQDFCGNDADQPSGHAGAPDRNIFCTSPLLPVDDLSAAELELFFGPHKRHVEQEQGQLLSFFCGNNNHVVLHSKEAVVDRPHAHIMQAEVALVPDENIMTTTSYMYGVFNSHISQGNVNFNRLLSVGSSQFNLERQTGQRIFVDIDGRQQLLGVPSAFEIGLNSCRWIYKHGAHCMQVRTWTSKTNPQVNMDFKVLQGTAVNILVSNELDKGNGWSIARGQTANEWIAKPSAESLISEHFPRAQFRILINGKIGNCRISGDETLQNDGASRGESFFVISASNTSEFCMSFVGELVRSTKAAVFEDANEQYRADCQDAQTAWQNLSSKLSLNGDHEDLATIREILPWYGVNALTHFLTPHGLEQVNGGAWGTRDTNQGPIELLLAMRKFEDAKQVLRIVFSNQNIDGGWPQWWMFDSYSSVRADEYHGDIFHWCLVALSKYLEATGDAEFLDEVLPYYHADGADTAEKTSLSEHVDRLINMVVASFFPGTSLVPFGGGDWNDAMQPASHEVAARMISTWTVELNYQAFAAYQAVCARFDRADQAATLKVICEKIKADFNHHLVKDETVSGHGLLEDDGSISLLLHPSDKKTNIQYRLLPMIRGIISGIFSPEQARHHQALIEKHLKGPDGARLMNRPPKYNGGRQTLFKRAESCPYFGREIGLMYTHAHLRYAESLAITGQADAFVKALRQANPVAYREVVRCGDIRQANCYYSSSDVSFKNRYEAEEKYEDLKAGRITLRGGWRIYSSGPGIFIGLIVSRLLGLRQSFGDTIIDPVIPRHLSGMSASMSFMGRNVTFTYTTMENGVGPSSIRVNDTGIEFSREHNQYRLGGATIPCDDFLTMLDKDENTVTVQL